MRINIVIASIVFIVSCGRRPDAIPEPKPATEMPTLILTETAGYRHESINAGVGMVRANAEKWQLKVTDTNNSNAFTKDNLGRYGLIVLMSTTGDVFSEEEEYALQRFVRNGGAILAIHAASDAEYDWPWYGQMIGGWFSDHPEMQEAQCEIKMQGHPSVSYLGPTWLRRDEWYNFKGLQPDNQIIINLDESSYNGGTHGNLHPISWCRQYDGGRIFYTGMGHTVESYSEEKFVRHIEGAILWLKNKQ